jgi:hypothetical protein
MQIHNLPAKHKALLDIMWELDDTQIMSFVKSLPYKDMRDAAYLIEVVNAGGDEVADVAQAKQIIDKIQKL